MSENNDSIRGVIQQARQNAAAGAKGESPTRAIIRDARAKTAAGEAPVQDESQTRAIIRTARENALTADAAAAQAASAAAAPADGSAKGGATDPATTSIEPGDRVNVAGGRVHVEKAKSRPRKL